MIEITEKSMNINHHYIAIKKLGYTPEYKSGKRNEGRFYALDSNGNRLTRYVEVIHSNSKIEIIKKPVFVPFANNTNADVDGFFVRSESTHVANATKKLLEEIKEALEHNQNFILELAKSHLKNI